jgi:hypothetical protein
VDCITGITWKKVSKLDLAGEEQVACLTIQIKSSVCAWCDRPFIVDLM